MSLRSAVHESCQLSEKLATRTVIVRRRPAAGSLPQRFEAAEIINRRRCERGHGDTNRW